MRSYAADAKPGDVYITGDTHACFGRVVSLCQVCGTTKDDVLVILGDVGINYYDDPQTYEDKKTLAKLPITLLCIHGNHERRPESIGGYMQKSWRGGVVYAEPEFPSLLFAKDGEIYELMGKRCIAIGGAYSVDKYIRLENGAGWWPDEQPSPEIKARVEEQLRAENWRVDFVFSHTCPYKYTPREGFLSFIDQSTIDNSTEHWLDRIEDRLIYEKWFCGHFHRYKVIDRMQFLYDDVLMLR